MIEIEPYLQKLCESLAASVIGESRPVTLKLVADKGTMPSADAISLGLIVTELVINALKYAFPHAGKKALVMVRYEVNGSDWKLSITDNGIGRGDGAAPPLKGGLGTSLVKALAHQLEAQVASLSGEAGLCVSVTHTTFVSRDTVSAFVE